MPPAIQLLRRLAMVAILLAWFTQPGLASEPATAPATAPAAGGAYGRIVEQYLDGKWEELGVDLAATLKERSTLPAGENADLDYIRKTLAESRPAWWKQSKAGGKFKFRPVVWGQPIAATFDPAGKGNIQTNYVNGVPSFVLTWNVKEMDSPANAEHGFTQGELNNMSVWSTLGTAQSWSTLPLRGQTNLDEAGKRLLSRYLLFRGNATAAYYGTPRSRRWVLWLGMWAYKKAHAGDPNIQTRKALGAMLIGELLSHPQKYPSFKLAEKPQDLTEETLAPHIQEFLGKTGFTLAEDIALRDALKAFCAANEIKTRASGIITLANGMTLNLDPALDQPLNAKRDAWLKRTAP